MPVETPSIFAQVIKENLDLKERNARLGGKMPIENYTEDGDPFENHPLFKSEEQARIEETMDGVDPDFSDAPLEDVGLGPWAGQEPEAAAPVAAPPADTWSDAPAVEEVPTPDAVPEVEETTGFWNTGGARDFDWGD